MENRISGFIVRLTVLFSMTCKLIEEPILFLAFPNPVPTSSPNISTGVIIGVVMSTALLLVVLIVACFLYKKKLGTNKQDTDNFEHGMYDDIQPHRDQIPDFERGNGDGSAEYTQLDSTMRVPIDANYQSLVKTRDQIQLGNIQAYYNVHDENVYEVAQ